MSEIGKISGQILADNLTREGSDLAFDTDLLYLDVVNRRVGFKSIAPYVDFLISGDTLTTNLIVDTQLTTPKFNFYTNTIQNPTGNILINVNSASGTLYAPGFKTSAGLEVRNSDIQTLNAGQDINLYPTGIGKTVVGQVGTPSDVLVDGALHATGDITFDGNIIFGNDDNDGVNIRADIASSIRPDVTETYSLGQSTPTAKTWNNLYSVTTETTDVTNTGSAYAGTVDLTQRQGKSWYVSTNGSDTNVGNHQNGPYATVAKALSVAASGDTIFVYPGTFVETTPLTIPVGVSIKGLDLRNTIITPSAATRNKDIFLLNGETTVEDLTITGFEYDVVGNTGYAFRFINNMRVTSRSPYIRNISVITTGSTVRLATNPADDPRGYLAGDAGKGALVDGSVVNSASKEASMLFHSVTFITPGVEALTMTNGVRVEWLNSFTYFAHRGLFATNGSLGFASQGTKFGAELRSINSANVYGDHAANGDGNAVIMYLVGHNFAYIGANQYSDNDPTRSIEGNQAITANGAKIYFQSTDQSGNVRVGNVFRVDGETGAINFASNTFNINGSSSILLSSGSYRTYLDPLEVTTGNVTFRGNTVSSLSGDLILSSSTQNILLNSTSPLTIPKGNDSTLILNTSGQARFNTSNNSFEGYAANGLLNLYSIGDSTRTTRITPELSPGASDQTIRMYANNDLKVSITSNKVTFKNLNLSNLHFAPSALNITSSASVTLAPTSGIVTVKNFSLTTDTITNETNNGTTVFASTSEGYWRFAGQGVVIPFGNDFTRAIAPETGMLRFNNDPGRNYLEIFTGSTWTVATGAADVTITDMEEISDFWALIIG